MKMKVEIYKREGKRHTTNMIRTGYSNDECVGNYFDVLVTSPYLVHTCPKYGDMTDHKIAIAKQLGVEDFDWAIDDWCNEDKEMPATVAAWVHDALTYALGQVDPGSWNEAFVRKGFAVLEGKEGWC